MDPQALVEQLALNPLDPKDLLSAFGLPGVLAILFAETGLLAGFFFPGDSLLFLAGVAASEVANSIFGDGAQLSIVGLLIGAPICAIIGAQFGHWLGAKYGRRMFDKPDSKLFKKEYVEKAEYYFEKFGPAKAVVLARFIPIVRTFLNPVAGTLGMPAKQFLVWNIVGGVLWTDGIILIGYLLAEQIYDAIGDKIDHYILPVVILIVLISVLPIGIEILRERKAKKKGTLTGPGAAESLGAVAMASPAGVADAVHEEFHHHQQQQQDRFDEATTFHQAGDYGQAQQQPGVYGQPPSGGYGQPQQPGVYGQPGGGYGQPQPPARGNVYGQPQQPAYPQQGHQPTPQSYPPQQEWPPRD